MEAFIEELLKKIDSTCVLFVKDEWKEGNESLQGVITDLTTLINTLSGIDGGEYYVNQMMPIIEVISQAMVNEDGIQIADLCGYDIKVVLQSLYLDIRQGDGADE